MKFGSSEVRLDENSLIIDNSWRTKAESLNNEAVLTIKKIDALDKLKKDMDVPKEICDNLQTKFESEKDVLLERRRSLSDKLKERMKLIDSQLRELYEFLTDVKISYHLRNISEETYQNSHMAFQLVIDRLLSEQDDIKFALNRLVANLSTLPPEPLKPLPPSKPLSSPIRVQIENE